MRLITLSLKDGTEAKVNVEQILYFVPSSIAKDITQIFFPTKNLTAVHSIKEVEEIILGLPYQTNPPEDGKKLRM